jgi:1-acyl-sn-glycerol-3-phosphate acyltransferase
MMQSIRSALFNSLFFIWVGLISITALTAAVFRGYRGITAVAEICGHGVRWLLKHTVGITVEFRGLEHVPKDGKFLVACKHQSAFETMILHNLVKNPTVIMKRELCFIPLFGQVLYFAGSILIDRNRGRSAIEQMLQGARRSLAQNRPVFIFPEGTRSPAGQAGKYRYGIVALYTKLQVPVLPIALNSGYFWPRRGFLKQPGHLIVEILPPILPGLTEAEFHSKLEEVIETACHRVAPSKTPTEPNTAKEPL